MNSGDDVRRIAKLVDYLEDGGYTVDTESIRTGQHPHGIRQMGGTGVEIIIGIPPERDSE